MMHIICTLKPLSMTKQFSHQIPDNMAVGEPNVL
jgi:hypothetical protein